MILFPYKADVELHRWPLMTLIVCVVCAWVYARQAISEHSYENAVESYCSSLTTDERLLVRYLEVPADASYCDVLLHIRKESDQDAAIKELAKTSRPTPFYSKRADNIEYIHGVLTESTQRFKQDVPRTLTDKLHFDPNHATLLTTVTAAFSHADIWHLLSNLIFFFAFAASVEAIAGYTYYFGFFLLSAIGTHFAYAYSVSGQDTAMPTIGLSGVVMAMMAFLATIKPDLRIRCFFWFLVFIRRFSVPALAIAALYIGENLYDYKHLDPKSNINYVAHISGAAIGILMGFIYRMRNDEYLIDLR